MEFFLELVTTLLFAVATWSYTKKSEAIRGLGRVVLGGAIFMTGVVFAFFTTGGLFLALVIMVCGVITAGAGLRKYARRDLPSAN